MSQQIGMRKALSSIVMSAGIFLLTAPAANPEPPKEFEAATIKPSRPESRPHSNFPLAGAAYVSNGGLFSVTNFPLEAYIFFAWNVEGTQAHSLMPPQLPRWVETDHFDIQARAAGNPGKDEMLAMVRALLADRLKLRIHTETRIVPVLGLVISRPGKTGPGLKRHSPGQSCPSSIAPASQGIEPQAYFNAVAGGLPALCNQVVGMPASNPRRIRSGARNVSPGFIANYLSGEGTFARPLVDATGLSGNYDFAIEWAPQGIPPPGSDFRPEPEGTTFEEAIHDQLGLKLKAMERPLEILIIDHIERPSDN